MAISINGTSGISGVDGSAGTPALQGTDTNTGIAFGSDVILGSTGGTERFRVDSSGRWLLGTSTSRAVGASNQRSLQVEGTTYSNSSLSLTCNSTSDAPIFAFGRSRGSVGGSTAVTNGDELGYITFSGANGSDLSNYAAWIACQVDGAVSGGGANDMPGRLVFSTTADGASSPAERMRIDNGGNVGIGDVSASDTRLLVKGPASGYGLIVQNSSGSATLFSQVTGRFGTGTGTQSPYNNTVVNAANAHIGSDGLLYRSTSSVRFKKDVEDLGDQYADAILNCRPVWYRSIAPGDAKQPDWGYWGFIAEEVAEIDPRLVFWKTHETEFGKDGVETSTELDEPIAEGVQYDRFVPHLLNLIKRQQAKIESLETRLAALEVTP